MARYNNGFGVSFNDNDGGASVFYSGEGLSDYERHVRIMGRLRARLFFIALLWKSFKQVDSAAKVEKEKLWKPLNGWQA